MLLVGGLAVIFDSTIMSIALKTLAVDLAVPVSTIQWVTTGYLLALGVAIPVVGWAQARLGGKRLWMIALTIFGIGLSAFIGQHYISFSLPGLKPIAIPLLSDIPVLGPVLFKQDWVVYLSFLAFAGVAWTLSKTRLGLLLKAIGESPESAHSIGYPVISIRFGAVAFGGAMAGIAGAYLSTVYTPLWVQNMSAGRGWIAVALVVFASWKPARLMLGAYLFGAVTILQFHAQGLGILVPVQFLAALPYVATIVVLVIISRDRRVLQNNLPASLGKPFLP